MPRRLTLVAALCALLALTSTAQAASIWTPVSSGTSDTISAIDYQSAARFRYATTNGHIASFNGSSFTQGAGDHRGGGLHGSRVSARRQRGVHRHEPRARLALHR